MSASNHNWVCFDCHFTIRRAKTTKTAPACKECGAACFCLGYKVEIPRKSDRKGWRRLRLVCRRREAEATQQRLQEHARNAVHARQRVSRLKSLDGNKDRDKVITGLKAEYGL